ncbi:hypothetical protein NDU88_003729 [Pleurodeles waltl]|uniref:Uncharacterized protein n=1 Tax=Pleurodeles waltl TaxID=8319 RepID=A0AAV7UDA4_PLEWA|nr:hypothetical protein NDU88_003729 [Pleurodeles waltl]
MLLGCELGPRHISCHNRARKFRKSRSGGRRSSGPAAERWCAVECRRTLNDTAVSGGGVEPLELRDREEWLHCGPLSACRGTGDIVEAACWGGGYSRRM